MWLLNLNCFEAIEGREVRCLWRLSFGDKNRGELNRDCGRRVGFCRELIREGGIDDGERGKSYFHYGKHNLGLQIETISGFCVLLL